MAKLIKCAECGSLVSTQAVACPQCKSEYFKGRLCAICLREGKHTQGYDRCRWVHLSCLKEINNQTYTCPTCGEITNIRIVEDFLEKADDEKIRSCPKCGHPISYNPCEICHYFILSDTAKKVKVRISFEWESRSVHQTCYSNWRSCGGISFFGKLKKGICKDPYYGF